MFERQFPILKRKIHGKRLIYLDNAATTQKPESVIRAMDDFYRRHNANVHRGIHTLAQEATNLYEGVRDKVQKFLNARYREEIIFTSGATEAINLVVWTWGHENIHRGDEILLTEMEHHSNLVPWQELAKKKGARLKFIPMNTSTTSPSFPPHHLGRGGKLSPQEMGRGARPPSSGRRPVGRGERSNHWGRLNLSNLNKLINRKTKIVALTHVSNVLGTINPIKKIAAAARRVGAKVLVDGAQAAGHLRIDVQRLGCDFYALSGHKMYGPTGVGVLYTRKQLLEKMPPYQTGGSMISEVDWQKAAWNELPWKFEAGTPNIAEVVGLGAAVDFLHKVGFEQISKHEARITKQVLKNLQKIREVEIWGPKTSENRAPVFSFTIAGLPPHDLASLLDREGVAIRTGHHCAMPLHRKLGLEGTARASFGIYNTEKDIAALIASIKHAIKIFRP